jgi:hypothetical protein
MAGDGLDNLLADGEGRIQRRHRLLKDHRQPVAAQILQGLFGDGQKIEAVEADLAGDLGRAFRQQAHHRQRGHALAAAGLADKAERRPLRHAEVEAVDGMHGAAVVAVKHHPQILDLDQRRDAHAPCSAIAADALPRLSPPVASPARIAAIMWVATGA